MENPKNAPMLKLTNKVMRGGASPAYQKTTDSGNFISTDYGKNKATYSASKDETNTQKFKQTKSGKTKVKTIRKDGDGDDQTTLTKVVKKGGGVEDGGSTKTKSKNISEKKADRIMARQRKKALNE